MIEGFKREQVASCGGEGGNEGDRVKEGNIEKGIGALKVGEKGGGIEEVGIGKEKGRSEGH